MFFNAFSRFFNETVSKDISIKYKVHNIYSHLDKGVIVSCEMIESGNLIDLDIKEIVQGNKWRYFDSSDVLLIADKFPILASESIAHEAQSSDKYYNFLGLAFILALIGSNLAAGKICNFYGLQLDAGTVIFPVLYVISDIVTEVYGYAQSRKVIRCALFCNIILSGFLFATTLFPSDSNISGNDAYNHIFSLSPRIFLASITSYYIGEMMNAYILSELKYKWQGRLFILRALVSTGIGATVESFMFSYIAFSAIISMQEILIMSATLAAIKVAYEIIVMPFTIKAVYFLKVLKSQI